MTTHAPEQHTATPDHGWPGMGSRFLTADIPGVGGVIRQRPEDFLVDEQPLYEPKGDGEHIYLLVQKRELTTAQAAIIVARHFGVRPGDIGYAGLKDKHAVTRQVFSVHAPGKKPEQFPQLRHDRIAVMWADLHANKLRLGHLRGNRFSIRIRGVDMSRAIHAERSLRRLAQIGVPNLAGEQRFGARNNNHTLGRLDLLGDAKSLLDELLGPDPLHPGHNDEARELYARGDHARALEATRGEARTECTALRALAQGATHEQAVRRIDSTQRRFWVTAFQSAVFNRVLAHRIDAGTHHTLAPGDLAWKHDNGAVFAVTDDTLAEPGFNDRIAGLHISPSGPLWGPRMKRATGDVDRLESDALSNTGVSLDAMLAYAQRTRQDIAGARRPLRVPVIDPEVEGGVDEHGHYVRCAFELPAGAFATVVLREIMKAAPESTNSDNAPDPSTTDAPTAEGDEPTG